MSEKVIRMLIDTEEFKHKLNNSKYYGTEVWDDICNMLAECKSHTPNTKNNDNKCCPYYTLIMETRYLSDAEMCKIYKLTGKIKRSTDYWVGHCMGTKEVEECHCDGLKEECDHKK